MEVPHVEREHHVVRQGVGEVELVRSHDVGFRADPEELAFHRVLHVPRVQALLEDPVQRLLQQLPRREAVRRQVLVPVRDPEVDDAGGAGLLAHGLADLAAAQGVVHPEVPDLPVPGGQCEPGLGQGMAEVGLVEVQADAQLLRPGHPGGEVPGPEGVTLDLLAAGLRVDGMDVRAVLPGDEGECLLVVRAQLVGRARLSGVVARGLDAAAGEARRVLEAPHVVALPAVQGQRDGGEGGERLLGVHAPGGVCLLCLRRSSGRLCPCRGPACGSSSSVCTVCARDQLVNARDGRPQQRGIVHGRDLPGARAVAGEQASASRIRP